MVKILKNGTAVFDGADIAAAFGMPNPCTKCASCGHKRNDHERIMDPDWDRNTMNPYIDKRNDTYAKCDHWDRRRTRSNGVCPCALFVEAEGDA